MILISHRGNLNGVNVKKENSVDYIEEALDQGFDVEVDVWNISGSYFLGHDEPQHLVKKDFLNNIFGNIYSCLSFFFSLKFS